MRSLTSGPVKRHARCGCADARDDAVAIPQSGQEILERKMKLLIIAGFRRDRGNRSRELAVLGIIGIRNDLHRTPLHQLED